MAAETTYQKDEAGNIIDPPILRGHEQEIVAAQAAGDDNLVHVLHNRYHADRADLVGEIEDADNEDVKDTDLNGDVKNAADLSASNSYEDLRNAARARGLNTAGGKIDLAARISEHECGNDDDPDNDNNPDDNPDT